MKKARKVFLEAAKIKAKDAGHTQRIDFNMGKYHNKVAIGKEQFEDLAKARQAAKAIKKEALDNLPTLLVEFESKMQANGGEVIWAEDSKQALDAIYSIVQQQAATTVVKSKSMITEEIELNEQLQKWGVEVLETDLGEFIVQTKGEKPYHIVTPAMHLSKTDIAQLFNTKFDTPLDYSPEELTHFVRVRLREQFAKADIGISGGNFLVADTGSVVLVTNEGNARLTTTLPKVHIAIVGIEKMIARLADLEIMLPVLSTFGTGQQLTVYNTILSGGKRSNEVDGVEKMYVILLDNGRSTMLADEKLQEALQCIRCGSCLNNCPVYQTIGGHTYGSPYSGPIGAVISPHLGIAPKGNYNHLSEASSLCGNCSENCPVGIDLHGLLLYNRTLAEPTISEKMLWSSWKYGVLNRGLMNSPAFLKNTLGNLFFGKSWGVERTFPTFDKKSFQQQWLERK